MTQFTQLGLSGKSEGKAPQNISRETRERLFSGKQKTVALVGTMVATSLLTIFLAETGCSKGSYRASVSTSNQIASNQPAPVSAAPSPAAPVATPEVRKPVHKKSRQQKVSTYKNPAYGVSFRYPKSYSLKEGEEASLQWDGLGPVEMNFVQPGGSMLTAVELPRNLYPGTDFTSGFFNVSVNPKLTSAQCDQFAFPESGSEAEPITPSKTTVGATEFNEMQTSTGGDTKQAAAKYYHIFQNGMCYEFALGMERTAASTVDGIKPVDGDRVFRKLNWIFSTVKIEPVEAPEVAAHAANASEDGSNQ
jgi:hypothetical protein